MILVVGGTGTLGEEICQRLRARGLAVRALARQTANPARLEGLRGAGVDLCWGDLRDEGSHSAAICIGHWRILCAAVWTRKTGGNPRQIRRETIAMAPVEATLQLQRVAACVGMLAPQPLEDPLGRVPLLGATTATPRHLVLEQYGRTHAPQRRRRPEPAPSLP